MGTPRHGITAAAVNKYLRGPGALYGDFIDLDNLGAATAFGETKGGSSFSYGLSFHDVEPDGAMGLVVGHRQIDKIIPTLSVSLLEHSVNEYLRHLPGADSANQQPTGIIGEYIGVGSDFDVGVSPAGSPEIDESTLEIWRTPAALGLAVKMTLDANYKMLDEITLATVVTGDVVVIGGLTFTAAAATDTTEREFKAGVGNDEDAIELAACINDTDDGVPGVTATPGTAVVTLTRAVAGTKNVMTHTPVSGATMTFDYQLIQRIAGVMQNDDKITCFYVYDKVASDTYTVIKPGQIEAEDHLTNVALLCEVSKVGQTYPIIFIIKHPLSEPDTIEIPGERVNETLLKTTWTGFFDPDDGLDLANAPVELWVPYGI